MTSAVPQPSAEIVAPPTRSAGSRDFEALWRALPREGLVPPRSAFNPARAGRILPRLILVEMATPARRGLYFRLVGQMLNENVQRNLAGANWLDFLPEAHHREAIESARLICEHPCGVWQLTPVHYERGFSQLIEATIFPLGPGADGVPLMLGYLEFLDAGAFNAAAVGRGLSAETSKVFEFLDVGAGLPAWTTARA